MSAHERELVRRIRKAARESRAIVGGIIAFLQGVSRSAN